MDPDGGIPSSRLRAQFAHQVSPIPSVHPLEGWTSCLKQLPPFNYGCLYAHLVTDLKTIAENQWSTAAATFGADAMKHKEEGYHFFPDDHVWMVGFPPDRHNHIHQEVSTDRHHNIHQEEATDRHHHIHQEEATDRHHHIHQEEATDRHHLYTKKRLQTDTIIYTKKRLQTDTIIYTKKSATDSSTIMVHQEECYRQTPSYTPRRGYRQ